MKTALYVVAGALLSLSGSMAAGQLLICALRLRLSRMEERLFALVAGAGCWSAIVYLLAWAHLARKGVFVALAATLIAAAILARRGLPPAEPSPELDKGMRWLFRALFTLFFALYFVHAAAPEIGLAGNHLGRVKTYWESRGFPAPIAGVQEPGPSAIDLLYLPAFSIGRNASAAMAHLGFLVALALGALSYARRRGCARAGAFASLMVFLSPLSAVDATVARAEVALACAVFFSYYALEVWRDTRQRRMLIVAGVLVIFAVAITTPAAAVTPAQKSADRPAYLLGRPIEVTLLGATGQGFFGPVFLLAPLGLLAARKTAGRRVLAAAVVVAALFPWGARLETALPSMAFVSLAMGLALMDSPGMIPLLVVVHAVLSLPWVTQIYSWPDTWRLRGWPLLAARHRVNEDAYLSERMFPSYVWARAIDEVATKKELVFSLAEPARAYCAARVIVAQESDGGRALYEMLQTPLRADLQAMETVRLSFVARPARAVRLTVGAASAPLRIHEVRLFSGRKEIEREPRWRLRATTNASHAGEAFDNSYVTQWSTIAAAAKGTNIEVDFGAAKILDAIALEWPEGQNGESLEVWARDGNRWERVPASAKRFASEPRRGLRRAAIFGLKQRGFHLLFVPNADPCAKDLLEKGLAWGVTPVRETHEAIIYRVD
jgi:hypothetical protein